LIKADIKLSLETIDVEEIIGKKSKRLLKSKRNYKKLMEAKDKLVLFASPRIAWVRYKIIEINDCKVVLEGGIELNNCKVASILHGCTELAACVCTIGPDVEITALEYAKKGDMFLSLMLDRMASWATNATRDCFLSWVKNELNTKEGLTITRYLYPGTKAWPITDQQLLFRLLDEEAEKVGVKINESHLMSPVKSMSFIFGIMPCKGKIKKTR